MARQFCRWQPELTMVGLRFSNVMDVADYAEFPAFDDDPQLRAWNLWGYIDGRDGAQAVRRALEHCAAGPGGAEVFVIANADTVMSRPSAELAAEVFPDVPVTRSLGEHETLLSIDKARRVLGYVPAHSWRDAQLHPERKRRRQGRPCQRCLRRLPGRTRRRDPGQPRHPDTSPVM